MTDADRKTSVGTVDDLHESAARAAGLTDFGDDTGYRGRCAILLDSTAAEAGLTPLGSKMFRFFSGRTCRRLLSEASWKANPGYADVESPAPIFVTGLPRTGTTALHRLLSADPAHQGLEMWLAEFPQPRRRAGVGRQPGVPADRRRTRAATSRTPSSWACTI